jgi:hypothetical protein
MQLLDGFITIHADTLLKRFFENVPYIPGHESEAGDQKDRDEERTTHLQSPCLGVGRKQGVSKQKLGFCDVRVDNFDHQSERDLWDLREHRPDSARYHCNENVLPVPLSVR